MRQSLLPNLPCSRFKRSASKTNVPLLNRQIIRAALSADLLPIKEAVIIIIVQEVITTQAAPTPSLPMIANAVTTISRQALTDLALETATTPVATKREALRAAIITMAAQEAAMATVPTSRETTAVVSTTVVVETLEETMMVATLSKTEGAALPEAAIDSLAGTSVVTMSTVDQEAETDPTSTGVASAAETTSAVEIVVVSVEATMEASEAATVVVSAEVSVVETVEASEVASEAAVVVETERMMMSPLTTPSTIRRSARQPQPSRPPMVRAMVLRPQAAINPATNPKAQGAMAVVVLMPRVMTTVLITNTNSKQTSLRTLLAECRISTIKLNE